MCPRAFVNTLCEYVGEVNRLKKLNNEKYSTNYCVKFKNTFCIFNDSQQIII